MNVNFLHLFIKLVEKADCHFTVWVTEKLLIWQGLGKFVWKLLLIFQHRERASLVQSQVALQTEDYKTYKYLLAHSI